MICQYLSPNQKLYFQLESIGIKWQKMGDNFGSRFTNPKKSYLIFWNILLELKN